MKKPKIPQIKLRKKRVGRKIIITLSVILLGILLSTQIIKAIKKIKCTDFKTQEQAQIAFKNGAKYLDKNKDGIACNSLKR